MITEKHIENVEVKAMLLMMKAPKIFLSTARNDSHISLINTTQESKCTCPYLRQQQMVYYFDQVLDGSHQLQQS